MGDGNNKIDLGKDGYQIFEFSVFPFPFSLHLHLALQQPQSDIIYRLSVPRYSCRTNTFFFLNFCFFSPYNCFWFVKKEKEGKSSVRVYYKLVKCQVRFLRYLKIF